MNQRSILLVEAGFSGVVVARALEEKGYQVEVIDKKDHVAGHAYGYTNHLGIRVHIAARTCFIPVTRQYISTEFHLGRLDIRLE